MSMTKIGVATPFPTERAKAKSPYAQADVASLNANNHLILDSNSKNEMLSLNFPQ